MAWCLPCCQGPRGAPLPPPGAGGAPRTRRGAGVAGGAAGLRVAVPPRRPLPVGGGRRVQPALQRRAGRRYAAGPAGPAGGQTPAAALSRGPRPPVSRWPKLGPSCQRAASPASPTSAVPGSVGSAAGMPAPHPTHGRGLGKALVGGGLFLAGAGDSLGARLGGAALMASALVYDALASRQPGSTCYGLFPHGGAPAALCAMRSLWQNKIRLRCEELI